MVIRNYHWLNSASRVLISTCFAPLVQTGERKQFSLFDLDLWPTTLTYNPRLAKVRVDPTAKNQGQRSNGSNRRAPTDKRTDTHTHGRYQTYYLPCYVVDNYISCPILPYSRLYLILQESVCFRKQHGWWRKKFHMAGGERSLSGSHPLQSRCSGTP